MSRHATGDNSNAIGLFPFLAVLLCTMGALLVLLVILAQRAGKQVAAERMQSSAFPVPTAASREAAELVRQLEEVQRYQQKLKELREQGEARVREEQQRLSHLEEHTRRLEHELAQLTLAAQQLKATENDQSVDQQQAEAELKRLQQLIVDTEGQLEDLRKPGAGKRSFAVVPFQGQNGTLRKPIYIECSAEGIILQPEGLRFDRSDFVDPTWPGNPLAAALRASREYLNNKAAQSGAPEPPDPYPLILVRPDGITAYLLARMAITSWDSDYGYEFIEQDWKIEYPDLPDPQLARAQQHAVLLARERLIRLVQAAPSQFRGVTVGPGRGHGGTSGDASGGYGAGSAEGGELALSYGDSTGSGNGASGGEGDTAGAGRGDDVTPGGGEFQYGAMGGDPNGSQGAGRYAGDGGENSIPGDFASASGPSGLSGQSANGTAAPSSSNQATGAPASAMANGAVTGSASGSTGGTSGTTTSSNMGQATASANTVTGGGSSLQVSPQAKITSIAESRGSDWAVEKAMRNAIPVRRTIQVVVRQNQMALLPSRHATRGVEATGTVISLDQSLDQISDKFVSALRTRVDEWGLAGNGLYWRPVLELHVGPDAAETAARLNHLLKDSGVELRLPETAQSPEGGSFHAPR